MTDELRSPAPLSEQEINRIADDASNSDTWVPGYPDPESDPVVMLTPKQVRDLCALALKGLATVCRYRKGLHSE